MKHETFFKIEPIGKCTAVAGMVIVAGNAYTVSTPHKGGQIAFYKNHKGKMIDGKAEHLNSITYHDHLFYVVTRNKDYQIYAFSSDGKIKKRWKYPRSKIATINHYSGDKFLISVNGGESIKYRMVRIRDQIEDVGIEFRVNVPPDYPTGNDSFYDKKDKRLYVTKFKENLRENAIYVVDLCKMANGRKYKPEKAFFVADKSKYEIEGVSVYDGKMFACVNKADGDEISILTR